MANRTVKDAKSIRGTNPQYLVEKIIRSRIYDSKYWKEECFALTAELLVDKAMELRFIGGVYGGNVKPTPFLCLILKMLQIQPEKDIIVEFIKNEEFKYVRALGGLYMRLTGSSLDCYKYLEPLFNDNRKLRIQNKQGKYESEGYRHWKRTWTMASNHRKTKRFLRVRKYHAKDRMITSARETVTETGTRSILGPKRSLRRKCRDRGAGREKETEGTANAVNHRNYTCLRTRRRRETETVTGETNVKENEREKGRETEIGEGNATELDTEPLKCKEKSDFSLSIVCTKNCTIE